MDSHLILELTAQELPYMPTDQQSMVLAALARFCVSDRARPVFVLNGYAGTGKTSLVAALVRALKRLNVQTVLLAPTGRAAKVLSSMAEIPAYTIHRRIYRPPLPGMPLEMTLTANRTKDTVFIVDEASMIGADDTPERTSLLEDLLTYVFTGDNCRLLLLGDKAQLPPVGTDNSPAMKPEVLKAMGMNVSSVVMTETVRQAKDSGILVNATWLRRKMFDNPSTPLFKVSGYDDVRPVEGYDLIDTLSSVYGRDGVESTLLVTRSNRSATRANLMIRNSIFAAEEELVRGERILVAKNNYVWGEKVEGLDFIANGDIATVESVHSSETKDGLRFADVTLRFPDRGGVEVEAKILLNSLTSESPTVEPELWQSFFNRRLMDPMLFEPGTTMESRMRRMRTDPWANALQVKYAYALTCHKAQGGQWKNVFVDTRSAAIPDESPTEHFRWLYTAFTRATDTLYLINPPEEALR